MPTLDECFELVSSLPSIWDIHRHLHSDYLTSIRMGVELAERFGFSGVLLHYNLHAMEPWPVVAVVLSATKSITPLIAAQPADLPPHTIARLCMTAAVLFGRRVDLNLITGAKPKEQTSVGDTLSHDLRYERLAEYCSVIRNILTASAPVTHHGRWYHYERFELSPPMRPELRPRMFVAGSSEAALAIASKHADVLVTHPQDVDTFAQNTVETISQASRAIRLSIRVGIIARADRGEARRVALERFPQSRHGELTTRLKAEADSHWIRVLAEDSLRSPGDQFDSVFWLGAYRSGKVYCPYLVGTYEEVAELLGKYHHLGATTLLVDGPDSLSEFEHLRLVLAMSVRPAGTQAGAQAKATTCSPTHRVSTLQGGRPEP